LVFDNATSIYGSAINLVNSYLEIQNCTITGNNRTPIYCRNSGIEVNSSIIYNEQGKSIYLDLDSDGCEIYYSNIFGGNNNIVNYGNTNIKWRNSINSDPLFIDSDNNDYHLLPESPCIDTGDNQPENNDWDGTGNDMGAYGGNFGNW
jgi:hypothetical protein